MASTRQQHPPANTNKKKKSHFLGYPAHPRTSVAASPGKRGLPRSGAVSRGRAPPLPGRLADPPQAAQTSARPPPGRRLRPRRHAAPPPAGRGQHRAGQRAAARARRRRDPRPSLRERAGRAAVGSRQPRRWAGQQRPKVGEPYLARSRTRRKKRAASLRGRPRYRSPRLQAHKKRPSTPPVPQLPPAPL